MKFESYKKARETSNELIKKLLSQGYEIDIAQCYKDGFENVVTLINTDEFENATIQFVLRNCGMECEIAVVGKTFDWMFGSIPNTVQQNLDSML